MEAQVPRFVTLLALITKRQTLGSFFEKTRLLLDSCLSSGLPPTMKPEQCETFVLALNCWYEPSQKLIFTLDLDNKMLTQGHEPNNKLILTKIIYVVPFLYNVVLNY